MCIDDDYRKNRIKHLATIYIVDNEIDVQIYFIEIGSRKIYNFEPINENRKNITEIIKWQKQKI